MSNIKYARIIGTACAVLVAFTSCGGPKQVPGLVPNREPEDAPAGHSPQFPSPDEGKYARELCFRRFPPPRC